MEQVILNTERIILKSITPALIHELYKTKSKEELFDYFGFNEVGFNHFTIMHQYGMETHSISLFYFILIDKKTMLPIGDCGFHTWNRKHRRTELFYNLHSDANKNQGIMTEVLKVVLEYGFTKLNLHRIEALVADWNTASVKLIQKYGFKFEGTMREDYNVDGVNESSDCYSLLKWEWEEQKSTL